MRARRIYFDNAATTPLDPRVRTAMEPWLEREYGNPASLHAEGRIAREAVEQARQHVAALVGAAREQVVFTSGGTEADNIALVGVALARAPKPLHIVTSQIEHPAVLETCRWLERWPNVRVTYLPVDKDGVIAPDSLVSAMCAETGLVSIMAANNVTGALQPIAVLAEIAHARGAWFHTDAVQAVGKLSIDIERDGIDLLSLSGHKLHGPKGVGGLIVGDGVVLRPVVHGGGQERGLRSGTENVAAIVGLGEAARLATSPDVEETILLVKLRDRIIEGILATVPNSYVIGHRFRRLPGHVCLGFAGLEGESIKLMLALDDAGIAVSTGSACSAHKASEPSYVLTAMGFDAVRARGAFRITLGRFNTEDEVERFLEILPRVIATLHPITRRGTAPAAGRASDGVVV